MDVIAPQLLWIQGRCYRVNLSSDTTENENSKNIGEFPQIDEEIFQIDDDEIDSEECYDIEQAPNNQFKTSFHVPSLFYGVLVGAKGSTKKRIQFETKTTIKIPKQGTNGLVEIIGSTQQSVVRARRRIELIILATRHKQDKTHFLCVPIVEQNIREKFVQFKNQILLNKVIHGIDESMFQNINKLHITLGTLSLMDNEDRTLATELFQDARDIVERVRMKFDGDLSMKIKGIEIMNDDASNCNVLYAKVDSPQLQIIADEIVNQFVAKGLMQRQYDHVKLHVTLINTRFVNESQSKGEDKKFDGRVVLEKYENYEFGIQEIKEIHLSMRYTTACDGFYEATYRVKRGHSANTYTKWEEWWFGQSVRKRS